MKTSADTAAASHAMEVSSDALARIDEQQTQHEAAESEQEHER
jgi:hypothetical protein